LASEEAKAAHAAGDEAWAAYVNSQPSPTVIPSDPEQEELAERLIEVVEERGLEETLKAARRKPPGRRTGHRIIVTAVCYEELFAKAMKESGGVISKAQNKFRRLTGLSRGRAYKKFAEIRGRQK
jgi:hypothetical protein